ncbi:MAG: GDP-mannose 4,6-dehydratase [Candidatus Marinimicrobia bacterium]|nr:GDP-mannose 4,6-dehydratase [Candidatus Neomarinimicrobiota bacterium]MCF7828732.1 GDP-mannose 4,6-dehydratase [Candidatus Neomarinimicrobiota bacterium]MCF7880649.1 GDP-mannose 4,6-dehydratase [Candidatus Neomarinimicrobiota bacterium]
MKYLITGGAGFIGSNLADQLIENGHKVVVIDDLSTGRLENINHLSDNDNFEYHVANIMNYGLLEYLVEQADIVYHLAAAVGVRLIMENPVETIITNVRGTENVLEACSKHNKKVLIASTSEVYGKLQELNGGIDLLNEEDDWMLGPTSKRRWAYAASKSLDEFLSLAYYDEKKLPVVIVRLFNTVGPRQRSRYGMVLPNFVKRALLNEKITVHGDGEQTRSFTYIDDVTWALTELMEREGVFGQIYNLGNGEEISINELAELVKEKADSKSEIVHIPYEEVYGPGFEDMQRRTPDITKIQEAIGYEPQYNINEIVERVIKYYRTR